MRGDKIGDTEQNGHLICDGNIKRNSFDLYFLFEQEPFFEKHARDGTRPSAADVHALSPPHTSPDACRGLKTGRTPFREETVTTPKSPRKSRGCKRTCERDRAREHTNKRGEGIRRRWSWDHRMAAFPRRGKDTPERETLHEQRGEFPKRKELPADKRQRRKASPCNGPFPRYVSDRSLFFVIFSSYMLWSASSMSSASVQGASGRRMDTPRLRARRTEGFSLRALVRSRV